MKGKCWIYKRATLFTEDEPPLLLDYSDGTEPFDGKVFTDDSGQLVYIWRIAGQILPIPVNVPRLATTSIVKTGTIDVDDGFIEWEYIYGKFRPLHHYMMVKFVQWLPLLLLLVLICRL